MTTITYNGICFHNCLIRSWDQEVQYDQSGTDLLFTRHRITAAGVAHAAESRDDLEGSICWIAPERGGNITSASWLFTEIREKLTAPRKSFKIAIGGVTVLEVEPADETAGDGARDADNGPKPKLLRFDRIVGATVHVVWEIELAVLPDCASDLAVQHGGGLVISNRWSIQESLDERFYTTRTITGRLRLSHPTVNAETARALIVPPLEHGFRRHSMKFAVTANGLDCDYEVVDRQTHTAAPSPAARMNVTHTEVSKNGYNWVTDFTIRMDGAPHSSKKMMMTRAIQIVLDRMGWSEFQLRSQDCAIHQIAMIDHIGDRNTIEMRLRLQRTFDVEEQRFLMLRNTFGRPLNFSTRAWAQDMPPYEVHKSPMPAVWGYDSHGDVRRPAVVMALACYLQDPCGDRHGYQVTGLPQQLPQKEKEKERTGGTTVEGIEVDELPEVSPGEISEQARKILYTHAAAETRYHEDTLRVGLPLGKTSVDKSGKVPYTYQGAADQSAAAGSLSPTTHWVELAQGPQARVTIRWEIERIGSWPELPEPKSQVTWKTSRGEVHLHLIRFDQDFTAPTLAADGERKVFAVEARMEYGLDRALARDEQLKIEYLPTVKFKENDRLVDRSKLYDKDLTP